MSVNLIHTFVVITQGDGKPGDLRYRNLFSTRNDEEVEELSNELMAKNAGFRRASQGRNKREVVVTRVDAREAEQWMATAGRNGLKAKPTVKGQKFESATAASGHVGLRHNEVAMLLSRCAATGEKQATVRGVTFAYADDVK